MNLKITVPFLIIGIVFISGCTEVNNKSPAIQGMSIAEIKSVVYESINDQFPEISNAYSINEYLYDSSSDRCGDQWFFEVEEEPLVYPRIQICQKGTAYTLDELYIAYQEAAQTYRKEEMLKDSLFEVKRETLNNGNVITFSIKNEEECENGITIRFPCESKYVVELITTYDCNNVLQENKIKNVADEILKHC